MKRMRLADRRIAKMIVGRVCLAVCMACMLVSLFPSALRAASVSEKKAGKDGESKIVKIGYYEDNEAFQTGYSDEDRKTGYAYEYYQEIARYTGWEYEYVYGSWDEIYKKLVNGEVDIMAGLTKEGTRDTQMNFSSYPMGGETYYIYMRENEDSMVGTDPATVLEGARIGVKKHGYMAELLKDYAKTNGFDCEIIAYPGLEERMEALENGEIEGILTVQTDRMEGMKPVFKIGSADFYFAVAKNRPDILAELDDAQSEILSEYPYYSIGLQDKYFNRSKMQKNFTEEEKKWIAGHPDLKVGYLADYMPFSGKGNGKTGMEGFLPDVLAELSEHMDINFTGVPYENYNDMIRDMENGEIDIAFPTFSDLWYSESQNYTQTITVASTQMCVISKENNDSIYNRIAISEVSPLQPFYIELNYPQAEQIRYAGWEECFQAVQSGEVGCMLVNSVLGHRYLNQHTEFADLNITEVGDTVAFCFAVKRNDSTLYSVLNKGLNNIDETVFSDLLTKNSYVEKKYTFRDFLVNNIVIFSALVLGFILLLITFFVLYTNRVKRDRLVLEEAYDKERKYIADQEEKLNIISSLSRIYRRVYYINLSDRIYQNITNLVFDKDNIALIAENEKPLANWIYAMVTAQYREKLAEFLDMETLSERMDAVDSLSMEYETRHQGWCRISFVSAGRDEQGKLTCVIYAEQDINEEKEAERWAQVALREAYEAASNANQAKSDFLSRMSHDIRTPMNAIIGMAAIATNHIDDKLRVRDCIQKITASGNHLLSLINEVLDMSKIESGKLELAEEEFNLHELIDNLINMMMPQIEARKHTIEVSVSNIQHMNVIGDSLHVQQVFVNILGNAVKYTPPGGILKLTATEKKMNQARIGGYEFVFEDNGIGMAPEYLEHIFEPFSRENDTRSNRVQGTGLGLSIVLNIVRMMGGDISVESEQGRGSKFTVTLYFQLQDKAEENFAMSIKRPVLVADPDKDSCEAACMILEDMDIRSEWVLSSKDAVSKIEQAKEPYFAVILDWKMLEADGLETAKRIRQIAGEELAIIILSANDWSKIEMEARAAGVNFFISKPLSASRLGYLMKRILSGKRGEENNPLAPMNDVDLHGKRILLAEDNEMNAEIAEEILGMTGLLVEHVWNGKEALETLQSAEPGYYSMVFMDVQMPVMGGYEAVKAIRATDREDLKTLPIVAMTANAFAEDVQEAIQAGMNQHIAKPLDVKQIMAVLQKWIS